MELRSWRTWLRPGMLIKRWILLILASVVMIALGIAMALTWAYRTHYASLAETSDFVQAVTFQFIPHPYREILFISAGLLGFSFAVWRLGHAVLGPLLALTSVRQPLAEIVARHRFGPDRPALNVVTIGGGTGLSNLLRGLKNEDVSITAIVTVADDGGSTGRIRREFDMPAPGDIRNCIVALASDESLVNDLFQYRFDRQESSLNGHSLGNLFITALTQVTGSFEQAVLEFGRVVNIRGRVLPSTLENVELCADLADGQQRCGESQIAQDEAPIVRVYLEPDAPAAYPAALEAVVNADLIVLGPGSLYTSVIPNLLVDGIVDAIRWSRGTTVYVCNVATQNGETDHYGAEEHIRVVQQYLGEDNLDFALVNSNPAAETASLAELTVEAVVIPENAAFEGKTAVLGDDVISDKNPLRHDPEKLSKALLSLPELSGVSPVSVRRDSIPHRAETEIR